MRKIYALAVFSFVVVCAGTVMAIPMQWSSADGGNDHWYDVVLLDPDPYLAWEDASGYANTAGGYLATITSETENNFVASLLASDNNVTRYWLGGYQTSNSGSPDENWAWVTGELWSWTNWYPGEPNNGVGGTQDYLHYWPINGQWDDMENGRYMAGYVMETPSLVPEPATFMETPSTVPEPTTMLLFGTGLIGLAGIARRKKQ